MKDGFGPPSPLTPVPPLPQVPLATVASVTGLLLLSLAAVLRTAAAASGAPQLHRNRFLSFPPNFPSHTDAHTSVNCPQAPAPPPSHRRHRNPSPSLTPSPLLQPPPCLLPSSPQACRPPAACRPPMHPDLNYLLILERFLAPTPHSVIIYHRFVTFFILPSMNFCARPPPPGHSSQWLLTPNSSNARE